MAAISPFPLASAMTQVKGHRAALQSRLRLIQVRATPAHRAETTPANLLPTDDRGNTMKDVTLYALVSALLLAAALAVAGLVATAEASVPRSASAPAADEIPAPHAMSVPF
ncbi:hypothetical protein LYSHEL_07220 [Lysobacter helvus]|uniref:Uncharacterized protein n=1 Tax=Lysobacter helvus TaxID=2675059 RepID=A0ABN6G225_9GAMM|nr:hypothetical protein LYSHEL_07220 [Lysobacter helvus]